MVVLVVIVVVIVVVVVVVVVVDIKEGKKQIFYLTTHSLVLFPISSKGSFICIITHTG